MFGFGLGSHFFCFFSWNKKAAEAAKEKAADDKPADDKTPAVATPADTATKTNAMEV
jgi:hypothetical protein